MAHGLNVRSSRKRGKTFLIAVTAAIAYIFLARQPLALASKLSFIGTTPSPPSDARDQTLPTGYWEENGRFFFVRDDSQGVSEIDRSGKPLWNGEFPAPITAVALTDTLSAWGLLDGSIHLIETGGAVNSVIKPASTGLSSRFSCLYGVALSPDGNMVAALFGLEPQHFAVFERDANGFRLMYDMKLIRSLRSGQLFAFAADGKSLAALTGDGLVYFDARKGRGAILRSKLFAGDCEISILPLGMDGFAFLAAQKGRRYVGILRQGRLEALFPVGADSAGIQVEGSTLTIQGKDAHYRYKAEER